MKRRNKQKVSGEVASTTEMINQTTRRVSSVPNLSLNGSDSIVEQASSEKSELLETVRLLTESQQNSMKELVSSLIPMIVGNQNHNHNDSDKRLFSFLFEARERKLHFKALPGEDAKVFINRLEALLDLKPLSFTDVKRVLSEILKGSVHDWYKIHEGDFTHFDDFRCIFLNTYVPVNYEAKLRQVICGRKQKGDESIIKFMSEIRRMNEELSNPLQDFELIEIFKLNLHPKFLVHVHLASIHTLNDLEHLCSKIEKALALKDCEDTVSQCNAIIDKSQIVCYKCGDKGHYAKECRHDKPKPSPSSQPSAGVNTNKGNQNSLEELTNLVKSLLDEVKLLKENQKN